MTPDLDTLLTALYLAVAQVLLGARTEHHWLRMCCARLGHLFPCLPKQHKLRPEIAALGEVPEPG